MSNNYKSKSDGQINWKIHHIVNKVPEGHATICIKDYCNNLTDAWPIIESIWDELMSPPYRGYGTKWERFMLDYDCGKLRAAMICFLKMKDNEQ